MPSSITTARTRGDSHSGGEEETAEKKRRRAKGRRDRGRIDLVNLRKNGSRAQERKIN